MLPLSTHGVWSSQAPVVPGTGSGGGGGVGVAARSTWDIVSILDALATFSVEDRLCDAVGEVVIDAHDDAVPLHCLGHVLLQGGVPPAVALRAVHQLVQVRVQRPVSFCLSTMLVLPWHNLQLR
jgi:hypothetical protein